MKLIAKATITTAPGRSVPPGVEFDTEEHGVSDKDAEVLVAQKFAEHPKAAEAAPAEDAAAEDTAPASEDAGEAAEAAPARSSKKVKA